MLPTLMWPPPPPEPAEQPVATGPRASRIAAAVIDLIPLTVLAVAWGERQHNGSGLRLQLNGWRFVLVIALSVGYYLISEGLTGTTLGKHLLGLVVVDEHGERAGWRAVAIRTVFRGVDALPVFYLVGFIVFLATPKRQRVGDLVAHTRVIRRSDVTNDSATRTGMATVITVVAAALVLVVALAGRAGDSQPSHVGQFDYSDDVVPFVDQFADDMFRAHDADRAMADMVSGATTRDEMTATLARLDEQLGDLTGEIDIVDHVVRPDSFVAGFGTHDLVEVYAKADFEQASARIRFAIIDDDGQLRVLRWDVRG